jgi:adenylate cyclase
LRKALEHYYLTLGRQDPVRIVIHFKGEKLRARKVGGALKVRFVVEGSLRRDAECIKIGVRLIDTTTGMQIWGEQYRRELHPGNIIALQEEVAQKVVGLIGDLFGVIPRQLSRESERKPPESIETYEAFFRV